MTYRSGIRAATILLALLLAGSVQAGDRELLGAIVGGTVGGIIGHQNGDRDEGLAIGALLGALRVDRVLPNRLRLGCDVCDSSCAPCTGHYGADRRRRDTVLGLALGGLAGGVIGHQLDEGDDDSRELGIAIGAGLGGLLGYTRADRIRGCSRAKKSAVPAVDGATSTGSAASPVSAARPVISHLPRSSSDRRISWRRAGGSRD